MAQALGAATVLGGVTAPLQPSDDARLGLSGAITFVLGRLAVGPEVGWYRTGGVEFSPSSRAENVVTLGGVARFDLTGPRAWVPFAVGAANLQFWESTRGAYPTESAGALSAGVGIRQGGARVIGLVGEARLHTSILNGYDRSRAFLTMTAGLDWRW